MSAEAGSRTAPPVRMITLRRIVAYTFLVELYNVLVILLGIVLRSEPQLNDKGFWEIVSIFAYTVIPEIIITFIIFLTVFYVTRQKWLYSRNFYKVIADILLSMVVAFAVYRLFLVVFHVFNPALRINWDEAFANVILILFIVETIYFSYNYRVTVKQAEEARSEALQYKYNVLKTQVNPHFLFNSLNILSSLVSIDVRKSEEFIASLSRMYRYVIDSQDKAVVPMEEELESLECYVSILKMRYCNQFEVRISGTDNAVGKKIVPMTLQLLIENVTKHNIVSTKYPMSVSVDMSSDDVSVSNPVRSRNVSGEGTGSTGVGLKYISEQYRANGKEVIIERGSDVFTVRIPYL